MKQKQKRAWLLWCLFLVVVMATVFVTLKGFLPKRYNLEEGDICPVDIYASGVITDKLTTEKLRKDAQEYVQKQYRFDLEVSDQVEKNLEDTIDQIHTMREKYDSANEMSEGEISASSLSREDWEFLFSTGQSELERFENSCRQAMEDTMKNGLDASQPDEAFAFLSENLNKRNFSQSARRVAYSLIASLLKPNKTYDAEATEAARQEATSKVEAVVYQKGEKIIGRGERINEADYAMMKEMGYIKKTDLSNLVTYIGLVAVVLMLFVFCCFLLRRRYAEAVERWNLTTAVMTAFLFMLLVLLFFIWKPEFQINLIPALTMAIIVVVTCREKTAFLLHFLFCAVTALAMRGDLEYFLICAMGGAMAIMLLQRVRSRIKIFICCLPVALFEGAMVIFWEMMENNVLRDALVNGFVMALGAVLSGILALGILPVLEAAFRLLTPFQLLEMTNSEHALLKRLMTEAPGTYHHSLMVGNLAENAASVIGADPLLTRVGAYYHDIGKLKQPIMYKENQLLENPHDDLTPRESAAIILQHPSDGVALAKRYNMPKRLTDFILQHHGNTATMYFYQRAKEEDPETRIEEFRYAGPKPQSREIALVMLADTVEAAIRTMRDDSPGAMERYVDQLVEGKLRDGQFSECDLTMADLEQVKASFVHTLKGYYHKRIAYQENQNGKD